MITSPFLAFAAGANRVAEQAEFQFVGIMVVMGCLGLLAVILACTGKFAVKTAANKAAKAAKTAAVAPVAAAQATASTPAPNPQGLTPELVAVISAAVHTALDGINHRIVNIQQSPYSGYSTSGRTEIFASRRLH